MNGLAALTTTTTMALLLGLALHAGDAVGQQTKISKTQLVGSWTLASNTASSPGVKTFGPNDGVAIFEANGRFSLQLVRSDLPKFASNKRDKGTPDENKAVVQGSITYFGTYSVNEADGTMTLHIERCSFPNWNGTDQKRLIVSLTADELKYTNPAASVGGTAELTWKRVK
jgi:Lipocalin-like domain